MSNSVDEDDGLSIFRSNDSPPGSPNTNPVSSKKKKSARLLSRVFLRLRGRKGKDVAVEENVFPDEETETQGSLVKYIYQELDRATAGFCTKNILGSGGSGTVYRGFLKGPDGQFMDVAIKDFPTAYVKVEASRYLAEIKLLSSLNHRNLVKLLGWCQETGHLLLVYEFVPNNTLASYLHGPYPASSLPWDVRYRKIAMGMASALLYLQTGWERCIVHRDIKSSNVLLDQEFRVKLVDFEFARLIGSEFEDTDVVIGTYGYIAPEYMKTGRCGKKVDIYSFGVVALEIACGRKSLERAGDEFVSLVSWVKSLHEKGEILKAADPSLGNELDKREMERLLLVGLWCTHEDPRSRPSVELIIQLLDFDVAVPSFQTRMLPQEHTVYRFPISELYDTSESRIICFEVSEPSDASCEESYCTPHSFDIGIPPRYEVVPMKDFHKPIMNGLVSGLKEMLKTRDEPLEFDKVLNTIRRYTKLLVEEGVPLEEWNSLAQIVLRVLSTTPDFDFADQEAAITEMLSSIHSDMNRCSSDMDRDTLELENVNKCLASAREERDSLKAKLSDIEKQIREAEDVCHSIQEEVTVVEQRRAQQRLVLEQKKRHYADIESLKKFPF